jgi:hypothetical protein
MNDTAKAPAHSVKHTSGHAKVTAARRRGDHSGLPLLLIDDIAVGND